VARELGVVCLVGCSNLSIESDTGTLRIGDWQGGSSDTITIDGASGQIYPGAQQLVEERPAELIAKVRSWRPAMPVD